MKQATDEGQLPQVWDTFLLFVLGLGHHPPQNHRLPALYDHCRFERVLIQNRQMKWQLKAVGGIALDPRNATILLVLKREDGILTERIL